MGRTRAARVVSLITAALCATVGATGAFAAIPRQPTVVRVMALPPTGGGVDISYPQCLANSNEQLPPGVPFAIIGVNGGVSSNSNPCLQTEFNSALLLTGTTEQPHAAVYVNTGNPSLAAVWWPDADATQSGSAVSNPDGTCQHKAGAACAYVYGYSMAQADYRRVHTTLTRLPGQWWLDVETTNTWQSDVVANAASLEGMVDYFESKSLSIGIYSTSFQWKKIAGVTPATSSLAGLKSWLAGGTFVGAPADCEKSALTPDGQVAMIQYVTHFDNDFSCHQFADPTAAITPAAPLAAGNELTADPGSWDAGHVSYSYQWNRNGSPIAGATTSEYATTTDDLDQIITVSITARELGFSTTTKTSNAVTAVPPVQAQPVSLSGTPAIGDVLTATTKAWAPATVLLSYAWYRGAILVESAGDIPTYTVSDADIGQTITVDVTGSRPGYVSVTQSATSAAVSQ